MPKKKQRRTKKNALKKKNAIKRMPKAVFKIHSAEL